MSLDMQHEMEYLETEYPTLEQISWEMDWDQNPPDTPEDEEMLSALHGQGNTTQEEAWYVNHVLPLFRESVVLP